MMKKLLPLAALLVSLFGCDPELGMAKIRQDLPDAGDDGGVDTDTETETDTDTDDGGAGDGGPGDGGPGDGGPDKGRRGA